jgi:hypothetical protein
MMEFSMRNHIFYTVLGAALIAGTSAANAQTVVPGTVVTKPAAIAPVETVETVRTVRSTTISPRHRIVSRHVIRSRTANRVTTTRRQPWWLLRRSRLSRRRLTPTSCRDRLWRQHRRIRSDSMTS